MSETIGDMNACESSISNLKDDEVFQIDTESRPYYSTPVPVVDG